MSLAPNSGKIKKKRGPEGPRLRSRDPVRFKSWKQAAKEHRSVESVHAGDEGGSFYTALVGGLDVESIGNLKHLFPQAAELVLPATARNLPFHPIWLRPTLSPAAQMSDSQKRFFGVRNVASPVSSGSFLP